MTEREVIKMPDNKKIDRDKLREELEAVKKKQTPKKLGDNLKKIISKDIEVSEKQDKTRAAEMISIFAAHNYYANGFTPVEMRTTLEDLGPTYVKIGQIMSSRVDLLPESYCKELEKLRQNVKPLASDVARAVIEEETGKKIDEIYSEFRDEPLGSASIGQAHYGVLKDGTRVVTKVQRPLIADMMRKDYELLKKLAELVNVVADDPDNQTIDLVSVLEELEKVTNEELDFRIEAENTKFFKEKCIPDEKVISCPTVIDELTTERIFTMTYVDGFSVAKKDRIIENGWDPLKIGKAIADSFVHQVFDIGTFHGDPHQGNIMISGGIPYWIDFGMIGHISSKDIDTIQSLILALLGKDTDGLVKAVMALSSDTSKINRDTIYRDAEAFIAKYANVTSLKDINMSAVITEVTDLLEKNHISIPSHLTMIGRAVLTIEGVIEELCPELDLFALMTEKMTERLKQSFDIKEVLLNAGKEAVGMGTKTLQIPGLIAEALGGLSAGRTKINMELTGLDEPLEKLSRLVKYVVLSFIACVLFIGSCILSMVRIPPLTSSGMPLIAVAGITFSIALAIYSVRKLSGK